MAIRLLALDLDGTLLPRSKHLSPRGRAAVRRATQAGIRVVLATGKTFHLATRYAEALSLAGPIIALDGALVRDWPGGETMRDVSFPREKVAGVVEALCDLPLRPFLCDARDRLVVHGDLEPLARFLSAYSARVDLSARPLAEAEGGLRFFGLLGAPSAVREAYARLEPFRGDGLHFFTADFFRPDVAMLMARPRVTKGAALALVAARLGIAREEVAAAGDWLNDVEMLNFAGLAAAMPESAPEVVAAAHLVLPCGPEEDGVARFIEDLLAAAR